MKYLLMLALLGSMTARAQTDLKHQLSPDPHQMFPSTFETNTVFVKITAVDNIGKTCLRISGTAGEACAEWTASTNGRVCEIYVGRYTSLRLLGHEYAHCIKGLYHKEPGEK